VICTIVVNSRVSDFLRCIIYPNLLIFYDTGILLHSYKNKTKSVRLLPVFAIFYRFLTVFSYCPGKDTFCHGKNPTMLRPSIDKMDTPQSLWCMASVIPDLQLPPQPMSIATAPGRHLFATLLKVGGWVGPSGCLGMKMVYLQTVTYLSIDWAQ